MLTTLDDKKKSNEIAVLPNVTFNACILAALMLAGSEVPKLVNAFPQLAREGYIRYNAPGGCMNLEEWLEEHTSTNSDAEVSGSLLGYLEDQFEKAYDGVERYMQEYGGPLC